MKTPKPQSITIPIGLYEEVLAFLNLHTNDSSPHTRERVDDLINAIHSAYPKSYKYKSINIIVAASLNWVIGKENTLPWKLRSDLKRFKELTTGNIIIMGRKTFESLPKGVLPDRTNLMITNNGNWNGGDKEIKGLVLCDDVQDAVNKAMLFDGEIFIIGGQSIYKQYLPFADKVYLTRVHTYIEGGDASFPDIDSMKEWKPTLKEDIYCADEKNEFPYSYQTYVNDNH